MAYGFERRYWLSSADFYELYQQGLLDDGEHAEDFAMWAGFYRIRLDREAGLRKRGEDGVYKKKMLEESPAGKRFVR